MSDTVDTTRIQELPPRWSDVVITELDSVGQDDVDPLCLE